MKNTRIHAGSTALAAVIGGVVLPAQAQVAFIMDMMTVHACTANNWGTADWSRQYSQVTAEKKAKLQTALDAEMGKGFVACMQSKRPMNQAACTQAIDASVKMPVVGGGVPFLPDPVKQVLGDDLEKAMAQCMK